MADNSTLPVAVGTEVFANNDIGPGVKYPRVKVVWGVPGVATDTSASNPLPVTGTVAVTSVGGTSNVGILGGGFGPATVKNAGSPPGTGDLGLVVAVRPDSYNPNGYTAEANASPVVVTNTTHSLPTIAGGNTYKLIAASSTNTVLQTSAGAVGDYIEGVLCVVGTPASSQVMLGDGGAPTAPTGEILPAGIAGGIGSYFIPVGAKSIVGSWRITTGTGVHCWVTGSFS